MGNLAQIQSPLYEKALLHVENKIVRDYRDGKVTKEQLDHCSTCDQNAKVNDGLSAASRAQLAHQTGEEIVDADIARQTVEQKKQQ